MDNADAPTDIKDSNVECSTTSPSQPTDNSENVASTNVSNVEPVNTSESEHEHTIPAEPNTTQGEPLDPNGISSDDNINQNIEKEDVPKRACHEEELPPAVPDEIRLQPMNVEEPLKESETLVSHEPSEIAEQNIQLLSAPLECTAQVPNMCESVVIGISSDGSINQNIEKEDVTKRACHEDELPPAVPDEIRLQPMNVEEPSKESETLVSHELSEIAEQNIQLLSASTPLECTAQVPNMCESVVIEPQESASSTTLHQHEDPNLSSHVNPCETSSSPSVQPVMALDSPHMQQCLNASGLSLLAAQYDSDSDSDDVCEVPATQSYQNRVVEIDSDSSTDVEITGEERDLEILTAGHGEEDDEENIRNSRPPKVKGELQFEDLPPIQDLHITVPEEECTELGKIQSIVEQLVLVNSLPGTVPLDLETVLFLDKGKQVLGEIFDVLGQVSDPLYCVRFNSNKAIKEKGIEVGQTVYVAPRTQHTQFIVLANLMKVRGSDASWENDVEPPPKFLDYSDDEEEREARRPARNRSAPMNTEHEAPKRHRFGGGSIPSRPFRGNYYGPPRQPHYQPPSDYNIAGNSWHSNYYQNYVHPQQQHQHYRMPVHPQNISGPPPPLSNPGMVLNPYAMYPPPQLMQQPLFPPQHAPPPPPPPGGY